MLLAVFNPRFLFPLIFSDLESNFETLGTVQLFRSTAHSSGKGKRELGRAVSGQGVCVSLTC